MKRASFINRKNAQIREKGRVCQNKHMHPEQEVHAHRARRGGFYTTKDMHPRPKRHTPTLRNRCAGTTQALHTSPKACMLTSKATCTYTREYMHIYKGVHTLIRKGHMHLHKRVHAFGQEVVMLALRNTRTRQGNRCP